MSESDKTTITKANGNLPQEFRGPPKFFRITFTLPVSLEAFVRQQAAMDHYAGNVSGYMRDLVLVHQSNLATVIKNPLAPRHHRARSSQAGL